MEQPGEIDDEQKRTLWVGGIDSQVDEELLYELMLNAGPIKSVKIPKDKQTKRSKPFAFVQFTYEESIPYAIELFCDTLLYGQRLRLQNRSTGAGISSPYQERKTPAAARDSRGQHLNTNALSGYQPQMNNSAPHLQLQHLQAQYMQMQQELQPWQQNMGMGSPGAMLNMNMGMGSPGAMLNMGLGAMSSPGATSSLAGGSSPASGGFIPPFLPPPPGVDGSPISRGGSGFQNMHFTINNPNYQGHQQQGGVGNDRRNGGGRYDRRNDGNNGRNEGRSHDRRYDGGNHDRRYEGGNRDRSSGGRSDSYSSNYDRRDDGSRRDRSRSNERSKSHGYGGPPTIGDQRR